MQVSISEATMDFSKLLLALESKETDFITIARNGKPIAKHTLIEKSPISNRIGIAKGKFKSPVDLDAYNDEIEKMLTRGMP